MSLQRASTTSSTTLPIAISYSDRSRSILLLVSGATDIVVITRTDSFGNAFRPAPGRTPPHFFLVSSENQAYLSAILTSNASIKPRCLLCLKPPGYSILSSFSRYSS